MRTISQIFTAGQTIEAYVPAELFYLLLTTSAVDITFFKNGAEVYKAVGMDAGFYAIPEDGFDKLSIYSAADQTVKFAVGKGQGGYNRTFGSVTVTSGSITSTAQQTAYTQAQATVTNASAQLLAAKSNRSRLLIQNKDAAGNIYVNLVGVAATVANGIKIAAGGDLLLECSLPNAAIFAIGDIASNANVVVVEG